MTEHELTDDELDHVCWLINHSQADHRQRAETEREENGDEEASQYHAGMHNGYESVRDLLEAYDIDVEARAERYADETDLEITATPER